MGQNTRAVAGKLIIAPLTGLRRHTRLPRRLTTTFVAALMILLVLALVGCSEVAPTSTPIPTPSPTNTPQPSPAPVAALSEGSMPMPDAGKLARLSHLLSTVPAQYTRALHLDLAALVKNPDVQEAIKLDKLGVMGALPPGATDLLQGLVVASEEDDEGLIVIMDGTLDVESLFQVAEAFGISLGGPSAEPYRDHQIWDIDLLGLKLAMGGVDGTTSVSASGATPGGGSAVDLVKGALDSFDGLRPQLVEDANVGRLISRVPSGIVTALFMSCTDLEDVSVISGLEGCAGAAVRVEVLTLETLAVNIVAGFGIEGEASTAAALIEQAGITLGSMTPQEMAANADGPLLTVRLLIDTADAAQAIEALIGSR